MGAVFILYRFSYIYYISFLPLHYKSFKYQIQDYLAYIAQASMYFRYYPQAFKEATCIVILKPGKPSYDEPKAYRPISLLNNMSKIIESIMTRRLQYQLRFRLFYLFVYLHN